MPASPVLAVIDQLRVSVQHNGTGVQLSEPNTRLLLELLAELVGAVSGSEYGLICDRVEAKEIRRRARQQAVGNARE